MQSGPRVRLIETLTALKPLSPPCLVLPMATVSAPGFLREIREKGELAMLPSVYAITTPLLSAGDMERHGTFKAPR